LIAGGDAGEPRAPIDHPGDKRKQRMAAGDPQVEAAPRAAPRPIRRSVCERGCNQRVGMIRQRRIGMKKNEHITAAMRRPGIHRGAAVARAHDHAIRQGARQRHGCVAAAANHDHLGAARPQRRQRLQCSGDDCRLVERWNDDGKPPRLKMHAGNIADKAAVGQPR
jgi:hypothetical protein